MNLLKFYRFDVWIRNLGISLIGILSLSHIPNSLLALIPLIQLFLLQSYSFSMNNYEDFKFRKEKNYIARLLKAGYDKKTIIFLCFLPLVILMLTIIYFDGVFLLLLAYIVLFFLYDSPYARLKKNWILSIIINSLCLALILYVYPYMFFSSTFTVLAITFSIIFFFYMAFHEMIHQLAHSRTEKILPKNLGMKGGVKVAQFILLIPIISSIIAILLDPSLNIIFVITIAFSIFRIYNLSKIKLDPKTFEKIKYSWHKFYSAHEGILYALFLVFMNYPF